MALSREILEHFLQTARVSSNVGQRRRQLQRKEKLFSRGAALRGFIAGFDKLRNANAVNLKLQALGVHFRKAQQVFGEPRQTSGMIEDDSEKAIAIIGIVDGTGD